MSKQQEIYSDIDENCDIILGLLKDYSVTNDTPEGRMIYQCRWLKEQVAAKTLPLPVEDYVYTLKHVSAEKLLRPIASTPEDYMQEVGIYLYRLLDLIDGDLLLKPAYHPYALRSIDALINLLQNAPRKLDEYEKGFIVELKQLRQSFSDGKIEPPLGAYMPEYPNFIEAKYSTKNIPNGKEYFKIVSDLIFEGVRPDAWLTPEDADRETQQFLQTNTS